MIANAFLPDCIIRPNRSVTPEVETLIAGSWYSSSAVRQEMLPFLACNRTVKRHQIEYG
jgi:hypothetical protein